MLGTFDITINGEGYTLYRAPGKGAQLSGQLRAATPGGSGIGSEVVRQFEDYSGGGGYSRRMIATGYEKTRNGYTRQPFVVAPGPYVTEVALPSGTPAISGGFFHKDLNGVFFVAGHSVFQLVGGSEPAVIIKDLGASFTATDTHGAAHNPILIAGVGAPLWYWDGAAWAQGTAAFAHLTGVRWTVGSALAGATGQGGVTQSVMVGALAGSAQVKWIADGVSPTAAANWNPSTGVTVGLANYYIKRLISGNRIVVVLKEEGVHLLGGDGYCPNLTPYWLEQVNGTYNGIAGVVWNGVCIAAHSQYLDMVPLDGKRQDNPHHCGPGEAPFPNESDVRGYYTAMTVVDGWLCVAKWNPDTHESWICYGRQREGGEDGYGPLVWHVGEIVLPGKVTWMLATSVGPLGTDGPPKLWIGTDEGGQAHLYWAPIAQGGNPFSDPQYRWATSASLYTGFDDGGTEHSWTRKSVRRFDVYADNVDGTGPSVTISTAMDGGPFVQDGVARSTQRTSFGASELVGTMVGLKIDLAGNTTKPPLLRSVNVHEILMPEQNKRRSYDIMLGMSGQWLGQVTDRRDPWPTFETLLAVQQLPDVAMRDEMGRETRAKMLPGAYYTEEPSPDGSGTFVLVAHIEMDEVLELWRWGDGTRYGSSVWGPST